MQVGLFLGAGASVPYGKPTTSQFMDVISNIDSDSQVRKILDKFILDNDFQDIEQVLQKINNMIDLPSYDGWDYFNSIADIFGHHDLVNVIENLQSTKTKIEDTIFETYAWAQTQNENLDSVCDSLFELFIGSSKKIIYTTNYDQAIERFCEYNNKKFADGFIPKFNTTRHIWNDSSLPGTVADLTENSYDGLNIFLYKLHGSLTWKEHKEYGIEKTTSERKRNDPNHVKDLLIYPTLDPKKELMDDEPFKTIFNGFCNTLEILDVCVVIGFSFRDKRITKEIRKFVEQKGRSLYVISPTATKDIFKNLLNTYKVQTSNIDTTKLGKGVITCMNTEINAKNALYVISKVRKMISDSDAST